MKLPETTDELSIAGGLVGAPINVVRATMNGLTELVTAERAAEERGVTVEELGVYCG